MEKIYNVTEFAEMIGKSVKTLQRWDREGILVAYRSPTKRRYYTHAQYLEYIGELDISDGANVVYARVYSTRQTAEMEAQLKILEKYTTKEGLVIDNVYTDYKSGYDLTRRKGWNKLIEDCFAGKIKTIYITEPTRFTSFGFDWISYILKTYCGVTIICVGDNALTRRAEEYYMEFLMFLDMYSMRLDGLGQMKEKIKNKIAEANNFRN